jgi:predicted phosphodiesterase
MFFGAVGDLHGDFDALDLIIARHPDVSIWLCPGDLVSESGEYPHPKAPLYWIKGNNEDFDFVARQSAGSGTIPNLHYIPNGVVLEVAGLRLAGLGGTFAPTVYTTPAAALPHPNRKNDRRRHFVQEEVEACCRLSPIDVFLSHEAARPYHIVQTRASGAAGRVDAGKTPINEVLAAMKPRLHLFGHHHVYTTNERQHVTSIGLDKASSSYLIFDGKTLAHERLLT